MRPFKLPQTLAMKSAFPGWRTIAMKCRQHGPFIFGTALFLAALLIRFPVTAAGLPYTHYWDEPFVVNPGIRIIQTGELNPRFQIYPGGYIYVQTIASTIAIFKLAGSGLLTYLNELQTQAHTNYLWTVPHPQIYKTGREVAALIGALTVLVTYIVGLRHFGFLSGVVSGLLVAFSPFLISHSTVIITDTPASLLTLIAIYYALIITHTTDWRNYLISGVAAGVAAGMKYNAGMVLLVPLLAHALALSRRLLHSRLLLLPLGAVVGFLVCSPFALLDFDEFVASMIYNFRHYTFGSHNKTEETSFQNFATYLNEFRFIAFSTVIVLFAFLGALLGPFTYGRVAIVLVVFLALYLRSFSTLKVHFLRNMMPIASLVALLASWPLQFAWNKSSFFKRSRKLTIVLRAAVLLLAGAMVLPILLAARREALIASRKVDTRELAIRFARAKLPADARVATDQLLHCVIPDDLRTSRVQEVLLGNKTSQELYGEGFRFLVTAADYEFATQSETNRAIVDALNSSYHRFPQVANFPGPPFRFGSMPVSPGIVIRRIAATPPPIVPVDAIAGLQMRSWGKSLPDHDNGALQLFTSGAILGEVDISSTATSLVLFASGIGGTKGYPKCTVRVEERRTKKSYDIAKDYVLTGWTQYPEHKFSCSIPAGQYTLYLLNPHGDVDFNPYPEGKTSVVGLKYASFR